MLQSFISLFLKILAGLLVDLADLLPDNIRARTPSVFGEKAGGIGVYKMGRRISRHRHPDRSLHNLFYDSLPHSPLSLQRCKPV